MGAAPEGPSEGRTITTASPPDDAIARPSFESGQLHVPGAAPAPRHLRLFVPGEPKAQGSMKGFSVAGRIQVIHAKSHDLATWRHAITASAHELWGDTPLLDEPCVCVLCFYVTRPKSIAKKRRHPDRRPDVDKLTRAVLDSLTGVVLADDARIVTLTAHKFYAVDSPCGVDISLRAVEDVS